MRTKCSGEHLFTALQGVHTEGSGSGTLVIIKRIKHGKMNAVS